MSAAVEAFMATMVAASRPVPVERALALVRERYGFTPEISRLTGERDENFRLRAKDGVEYVLKIANPAEKAAETDFQTAALLHLERADPALPVPRVVRTHAGEPYVRFTDHAGGERTARLLTYLPGKLLGAANRSSAQRTACGRIGGQLARAFRDFRHAAEERAIVWDVRHTGYMRHLLADMPAFPYRTPSETLLERLAPHIDSELPKLRHQILHNDLNPLNILVDPADEACVVGVIDFGDMTRAAVIADVAVAAAELIAPDCTEAAARAAVREVAIAYHACTPLQERELALLGILAAARVLMTVVIHEWHVQHNPASEHYAPLPDHTMRARLGIADALAREEIRL
jgi:hydroxylysine kinase